jgi:hypothetical protein
MICSSLYRLPFICPSPSGDELYGNSRDFSGGTPVLLDDSFQRRSSRSIKNELAEQTSRLTDFNERNVPLLISWQALSICAQDSEPGVVLRDLATVIRAEDPIQVSREEMVVLSTLFLDTFLGSRAKGRSVSLKMSEQQLS